MDQHLQGSWEMIANHIIEQMKCHEGCFPARDTFIAKAGK